jgi:hypothetical protein
MNIYPHSTNIIANNKRLWFLPFKVGSRFITQTFNIDFIRVHFESVNSFKTDYTYYHEEPNGFFEHDEEVTNMLNFPYDFKHIFVYRDPIERFKTGLVQEIKEYVSHRKFHNDAWEVQEDYWLKNYRKFIIYGQEFVDNHQGVNQTLMHLTHCKPYLSFYLDYVNKNKLKNFVFLELKDLSEYLGIKNLNKEESNKHLLNVIKFLKLPDIEELNKDEIKSYNIIKKMVT